MGFGALSLALQFEECMTAVTLCSYVMQAAAFSEIEDESTDLKEE